MKTKLCNYRVHVRFQTISVFVTAKNKVEAIRKVKQKVAAMNAAKLMDLQDFFVERE